MSVYAATRRELLARSAALAAAAVLPPGMLDPAGEPIYPDDAFSRPAEDRLITFETLDAVGPYLDVRERAAQYSENDLRLVTTGSGVFSRWRFRSRILPHNALFVQTKVRRAPEAISFRVRNRSDRPVSFEVQAHELAWMPVKENVAVVWVLGDPQTVTGGEERVLRFAWADARAAGRAVPRFPLVALLLLAKNLAPGAPYEVELADLTVHYPPAQDIRVKSLSARVTSSVAVFTATLDVPAPGPPAQVDLEVRRDDHVLWRVRLTPAEMSTLPSGRCRAVRALPWYLPEGRYTVGLVSNGYRARGPEAALVLQAPRDAKRRAPASANPLPRAERRVHRGRPAFFLNGKPFAWQGYSSYDYQPGSVAEFGASGTNVFCVPACAGRHVHHVSAPTWVAHDRWDFGELDERVCFSLQANPDALLFLRVSLALPAFWLQEHEAELTRIMTDIGPLIWEEGGVTRSGSLASDAWLRDQAMALRRLIQHCRAQPWASRLAGFWLTCEVTEEWFAWGCNDGKYGDYSAPSVRRFGKPIPLPDARKRPGYDLYPDDEAGRQASAYHRFLSDLTADTIGHFARAVKEETGGRSLVGCFYGYVIELAGEPRQALSGHFALRRLLDDANVDFLGGVPLLDFRDLTSGYNPYCSATESIAAAGKLYCNENDLFSWLHPILWHTEYDRSDPRAAAISMHQRECANDAVHGAMAQKFSLAASWHHDAALHRAFGRQRAVYARALDSDRTSAAEIAFVVDDNGFGAAPPESALLAWAHKLLLRALGRTGAPVGVWLLSDIYRLPESAQFVVIASAASAAPVAISRLREVVERGRRTILVVGPVGLVNPESGHWDPGAPARLLGLPIRVVDEARSGKARIGDAWVCGLASVRPRGEVPASSLMLYEDGAGAGAERPLAAGGRLIWCGVPPVSEQILRTWAERAGVHLYAPQGFFVHASRDLVAVTSPASTTVELRWPESVKVVDLFDGWSASGRATPCHFAAGQTRLFRLRR